LGRLAGRRIDYPAASAAIQRFTRRLAEDSALRKEAEKVKTLLNVETCALLVGSAAQALPCATSGGCCRNKDKLNSLLAELNEP
jgi:hypothetical protein